MGQKTMNLLSDGNGSVPRFRGSGDGGLIAETAPMGASPVGNKNGDDKGSGRGFSGAAVRDPNRDRCVLPGSSHRWGCHVPVPWCWMLSEH